jgi:hypothetical protein
MKKGIITSICLFVSVSNVIMGPFPIVDYSTEIFKHNYVHAWQLFFISLAFLGGLLYTIAFIFVKIEENKTRSSIRP